MRCLVFLLWCIFVSVNSQVDLENVIKEIFTTPDNSFLDDYHTVSPLPSQESIGAMEKCGEGGEQGVRVCVPYYLCHPKNNTIQQNGIIDGFGVIEIRFGYNFCSHPLEVCCKLPPETKKPPIKENGRANKTEVVYTSAITRPTPPTTIQTTRFSRTRLPPQPSTIPTETTTLPPSTFSQAFTIQKQKLTTPKSFRRTRRPITTVKPPSTILFQPEIITSVVEFLQTTSTESSRRSSFIRPSTTSTPSTNKPLFNPFLRPSRRNRTRSASCGIRNSNGIDFKITGNSHNEAEYGEFPWMVAVLRKQLLINESSSICGGSIITPNVVLTGAHCVKQYKTNEIRIRAGEWDTQTENERLPYQERDVSDIIMHADFETDTLNNDVALLILSVPFNPADNVGTVCLPPEDLQFDSTECFASGWGKDIFGKAGQPQVILKKIQLPIVPRRKCQYALRRTRLGKTFKLHESFLCAGGEEGLDTCTGDGGSPLVCPDPQNPKRYLQAGIVAWGIGCGEKHVPGVYADVSHFRCWIDKQLEKLKIDTSSYK